MPFLLASLAFHYPWLDANMTADHPLRSAFIWRNGIVRRYHEERKVVTGINICKSTSMTATGIPPTLLIMHELHAMVDQLSALSAALVRRDIEVTEKVAAIARTLPAEVCDKLVENFSISGVAPITNERLVSEFSRLKADLFKEMQNFGKSNIAATANAQVSQFEADARRGSFETWNWNGRDHPVPETFMFASNCMKFIWDKWHFGDAENHIRPYKYIRKSDIVGKVIIASTLFSIVHC